MTTATTPDLSPLLERFPTLDGQHPAIVAADVMPHVCEQLELLERLFRGAATAAVVTDVLPHDETALALFAGAVSDRLERLRRLLEAYEAYSGVASQGHVPRARVVTEFGGGAR
jgi:hypothetical protein